MNNALIVVASVMMFCLGMFGDLVSGLLGYIAGSLTVVWIWQRHK